jgi:hypothetical protein
MLEHLLQSEQESLLGTMVEAARNVPSDKREKFLVAAPVGSTQHFLFHPGLRDSAGVYGGDIEVLIDEGLLRRSSDGMIDVAPAGYAYYEEMKRRSGEPTREIESTVMDYLNAEPFRERYPEAHQKWSQASERPWSSDSERELTVVGHLCREAMQAFATALVERYVPPHVDPDRQHVVARIRAVLTLHRGRLGTTELPFLDALLAYWGTVSDLVQRQEHGAQREGESLVWEDGRRVVFQTANVMFEIDRSLTRLG